MLKTCSNSVDKVLKSQYHVYNLLKTCSEVQTANTNGGDLKNSTTDTAVGEPPTKRVTTTDICVGQERKVTTTTNIFKHSPLYPPAGEKSKNGAGRTLPNVKNFSGRFADCRSSCGGTMTDLLFGLPFGEKNGTVLEKPPTSNDFCGNIPPS